MSLIAIANKLKEKILNHQICILLKFYNLKNLEFILKYTTTCSLLGFQHTTRIKLESNFWNSHIFTDFELEGYISIYRYFDFALNRSV